MDAAGDVIAHAIYDPWGAPVTETYTDSNFSGIENLTNFTGYTWDEVLGLYFAQNRFYDAESHRFTQEDPIEYGTNWYVYCGNEPMLHVDWLGLDFWDWMNPEPYDPANPLPPADPGPPPLSPPRTPPTVGPINPDNLDFSNTVLSWGSTGPPVERLQTLLVQYGYMTSDNITGGFYDITKAAVEWFQIANGLVDANGNPDGVVGPLTWAALLGNPVTFDEYKNTVAPPVSTSGPNIVSGDGYMETASCDNNNATSTDLNNLAARLHHLQNNPEHNAEILRELELFRIMYGGVSYSNAMDPTIYIKSKTQRIIDAIADNAASEVFDNFLVNMIVDIYDIINELENNPTIHQSFKDTVPSAGFYKLTTITLEVYDEVTCKYARLVARYASEVDSGGNLTGKQYGMTIEFFNLQTYSVF